MHGLLATLWKRTGGLWQWYALWLAHSKFIIGVSGVIMDEEQRVLLLRHRYWKDGSWGLPGGYAQRQERLEEAIAREVREETGYVVEATTLIGVVSGYKLRVEISYLGRLVGGSLRLDSGEVLEARFFPVDALPDGLIGSHRRLIGLALRDAREAA